MTISMDKEYMTRDGREVRIYAVDGRAKYPVHGAVKCNDGWADKTWVASGTAYAFKVGATSGDLIEKPAMIEPRVIWVNEYSQGLNAHPTKEKALEYVDGAKRVAVRYVETPDPKE